MMPRLVYYQLGILGPALVVYHAALPLAQPTQWDASAQRPIPSRPKRKRSSEPKPFAGLTQKPPCALCEHERGETTPPPPVRPDPMPVTNRRPCVIDTSMHFCPHDGCEYRGWLGLGNLRANGHPSGGPWRQLSCRSCHGYFWNRTAHFHAKRCRWSSSSTCWPRGRRVRYPCNPRVLESRLTPSCHGWWKRPSSSGFYQLFPLRLQVHKLQLDESYAVLRGLRGDQCRADPQVPRVWPSLGLDSDRSREQGAAGHRRRAADGRDGPARGAPSREPAGTRLCACLLQRWVQGVSACHCGPLWHVDATRTSSGQGRPSQTALDAAARTARCTVVQISAQACGGGEAPRRVRHAAGDRADPGGVWLEDQYRHGQRLNLDIRQRVAAIGWRVNTLCQGVDSIQQQLAVFHAYHNFVLPHASLRQPLPNPARPMARVSPAVAAGYTSHGGRIDRPWADAARSPALPPTFKGVWYAAVHFAPLPLLDTRRDNATASQTRR